MSYTVSPTLVRVTHLPPEDNPPGTALSSLIYPLLNFDTASCIRSEIIYTGCLAVSTMRLATPPACRAVPSPSSRSFSRVQWARLTLYKDFRSRPWSTTIQTHDECQHKPHRYAQVATDSPTSDADNDRLQTGFPL